MDVSPQDARASLDQVQDVTTRTRRSVASSTGGPIFMVWGLVWIVGMLIIQWRPHWSGRAWTTLDVLGFAATLLIVFSQRANVKPSPAGRRQGLRICIFWLSLIPFMAVWVTLLQPIDELQLFAFICTVPLFALVVMGLWLESYSLVVVGFAVTGSVLLGYTQFPKHFGLWMALTGGGTMFVVGLLMRLRWR